MDEPCGIPCGFLVVKVATSESSVHAPRTVTLSWFVPAPLRIVPKEPKGGTFVQRIARIISPDPVPITTPIRAECVNPPDRIEAIAEWQKRKADYHAHHERRLQRIDWYLNQRSARR